MKNLSLRKNLLFFLFLALIISAGLFVYSFSFTKASAEGASENSLHREFYYAESNHSAGTVFNSDFSTNIENSSAVVSKTYYIQISQKTYNQLDSNYNHLVVSWGRKSEMDILANACKSDSEVGDPSFEIDVSSLETLGICSSLSSAPSYVWFNYNLYGSAFKNAVKFPYVGYRVQQSDVIDYNSGVGFGVGYGAILNAGYYVPITVSWKAGELFDIGIMLTYQYSAGISTRDTRINGYWTDSTVVSTVKNRVSHASSYNQNVVGAYEKALGIYRAGNTTVNYTYLKMLDGHFNKYEVLTDSISVQSVYVPDEEFVSSLVLNSDYANGNGLIGYNANYISTAGYLMENGRITEVETFGSKTVRQATGYSYSYVFGRNIPETVSCDIVYSDYRYSDFYIKIANSGNSDDPEVEGYFDNNLNIEVYPTSVEQRNGKYYLYFDYNTIFTLFGNTLHWSVEREYFSLVYDSADIKEHVYVGEETLSGNNKRLVVSFDEGYEENLFGLEIVGTAPITEPTEFECYVDYRKLNEDLTYTTKSFYAGTYYDNDFGGLIATLMDTNGTFADKIYGSLDAEILNGITFMRPVSVVYVSDYMDLSARFEVRYEYNSSVLVVENNLNSGKWVYSLSNNLAEHSLELLGVKSRLPAGYRVESFTGNRFYITEANNGNPLKTKFVKSDVDISEPYLISLKLSNFWPVRINYLERYKNSCFAVMKEHKGSLLVSDYPSDEDGNLVLSNSDISTILGEDKVVLQFVKKSVRVSDILVSYDEYSDSYTVDLAYTYLSVKTIDSSGHAEETKVGLTPFSVWCEYFGRDWSILYLAPDVFKYSDEVATDKLYGFFTMITFKEKVSDLSLWFKNQTGEGCCTVFSESRVEGSWFYKFLRGTTAAFTVAGGAVGAFFGHPLAGAAAGTAVHFGLESITECIDDSAGTYYTYFFYLDGNTNKAFYSHSGADSYDDTDSAFVNKVQDWWDDIKNSTIFEIVKIIVYVLLAVIGIVLVIKLIRWGMERK